MIRERALATNERVREKRRERFERNRKAMADKTRLEFAPGDKIYLSFPKGRFRPKGGSTKLSRRNDGPYTVLERKCNGLVYSVQNDNSGVTTKVSMTRMIPAEARNISKDAVDLPGLWSRFKKFREDQQQEVSLEPLGSAPPVEVDDEAEEKEMEWEESTDEEVKEEPDESIGITGKNKEAAGQRISDQTSVHKTNPNALRAPYMHKTEDREKDTGHAN